MTEGNGKTPLLMSSRLGRVCLPQESKDNAGGCNNYSRKVGRSIRRKDHQTRTTVLRNTLLVVSSRKEDPLITLLRQGAVSLVNSLSTTVGLKITTTRVALMRKNIGTNR